MWMNPEEIAKLNKDLDKVSKSLLKNSKSVVTWVNKELTYSGNEMRNAIMQSFRDTERAPWSYYRGEGNRHHPSLPYQPPAIDFGHLVRSIFYDVGEMQMMIGSLAGEAPHGLFMEFGTTGLASMGYIIEPRPWLAPIVTEYIDDIRSRIGNITVEYIGQPFESIS